MVDHDVEPHLDVVVVRGGDQIGEFLGGMVTGRVLTMDRTEHERHVSPVVAFVGVVLMHREQFEHRHPEVGEARKLVDRRSVRAGIGTVAAPVRPRT